MIPGRNSIRQPFFPIGNSTMKTSYLFFRVEGKLLLGEKLFSDSFFFFLFQFDVMTGSWNLIVFVPDLRAFALQSSPGISKLTLNLNH